MIVIICQDRTNFRSWLRYRSKESPSFQWVRSPGVFAAAIRRKPVAGSAIEGLRTRKKYWILGGGRTRRRTPWNHLRRCGLKGNKSFDRVDLLRRPRPRV